MNDQHDFYMKSQVGVRIKDEPVREARVLHLTLKKKWFDLMIAGLKKAEYRKPSKWIQSRLEGKEYDLIKFVNGYGDDKPYFFCEYEGYEKVEKGFVQRFDHNTDNTKSWHVLVDKGDYIIQLGEILYKGNLKENE